MNGRTLESLIQQSLCSLVTTGKGQRGKKENKTKDKSKKVKE